ncbi:zinc finger protein 668-like [Pomacea canaliculata]|uniref:zinc finger protein 668-like n=1 Tax=Pomacea canaliculata TaxID=400727 RepID=UPI000D7293F3|nr:zinc finger protein 668-like [Pomacea canaliculata]
MEERDDGGLVLGADINHELVASICVEEPLISPTPSSLFEELTSNLIDQSDIDLYLECDDDKSYAVPQLQDDAPSHSLLGSNVSMRISFPTPPSDTGTDEGFSCKYCKCNFLSQKHLSLHTRTAHGEGSISNGKIKKNAGVDVEGEVNQTNGRKFLLSSPGSAAALVPSLFSPGIPRKIKSNYVKRKHLKKKTVGHLSITKRSKSDSEVVPSKLVDSPSGSGKKKLQMQQESSNETIDVESYSSDSSPGSQKAQESLDKQQISGVSYTCAICMKTYVSKYALKRHVATHSDERPFVCSFPGCKGAFKLKSRLTDHVRYVHKRKTARAVSRSKPLLTSASTPAEQPSHAAEQQLQAKTNTTAKDASAVPNPGNSNLSNGSSASNIPASGKASSSMKFKCPEPNCSREFRDSHNLRNHMCLHTGCLPLKCTQCDYRCVQESSLRWHHNKMHV